MTHKQLSQSQKEKLTELLSKAVINKQHEHPSDLQRAALVLYDVNRLGYRLEDTELNELLNQSQYPYSDSVRETLANMTNAYADLVTAMNDPEYSNFRIKEEDFKE